MKHAFNAGRDPRKDNQLGVASAEHIFYDCRTRDRLFTSDRSERL